MRKLSLLFILLLPFTVKVYGQQFYIATSRSGIQYVTVTNGVPSLQSTTSCASSSIFGIAMHGKSFYYMAPAASGTILYKGDINNNVISNCTVLANLGSVSPNSLTIDNSGTLYYASPTVLYKINLNNPVPVTIGTLPYISGGDLAFYNNDLYLASPTDIVKINLADPSQSTVYIHIALPNTTLWGLTPVQINGKTEFYAFSVFGSQTDVLEIDMANQKLIGKVFTLPYIVNDAASLSEGGTTPDLKIDSIYINQVCSLTNKGEVQIIASPDITGAILTYTLSNSGSNTTGIFNNISPGSYLAQIASSTGVEKDTMITVPDYRFNKTTLNILKTNPVCTSTGKIQFKVADSNPYTVQYNSDTFPINHVFTGLAANSYNFTLLNQGGCPVDTLNVSLIQDQCYPPIVFPNTFTPNNDSINDVFGPNADSNANNYNLKIYNRYGTIIFESNSIHTGWDGLYQGKQAAVGTYYWIATYTTVAGKADKQSGSVALIR